jgi:hypothetical protein
MLHGLAKLTWIEIKVFLREPMGAFGTIGVPVLLYVILGHVLGSRPASTSFTTAGYSAVHLPVLVALFISINTVLSLVTIISIYREGGILKRLRATPLRPQTILSAHVIVKLLLTAATLVLMFLAADATPVRMPLRTSSPSRSPSSSPRSASSPSAFSSPASCPPPALHSPSVRSSSTPWWESLASLSPSPCSPQRSRLSRVSFPSPTPSACFRESGLATVGSLTPATSPPSPLSSSFAPPFQPVSFAGSRNPAAERYAFHWPTQTRRRRSVC